jgi:hypothetical protein
MRSGSATGRPRGTDIRNRPNSNLGIAEEHLITNLLQATTDESVHGVRERLLGAA